MRVLVLLPSHQLDSKRRELDFSFSPSISRFFRDSGWNALATPGYDTKPEKAAEERRAGGLLRHLCFYSPREHKDEASSVPPFFFFERQAGATFRCYVAGPAHDLWTSLLCGPLLAVDAQTPPSLAQNVANQEECRPTIKASGILFPAILLIATQAGSYRRTLPSTPLGFRPPILLAS